VWGRETDYGAERQRHNVIRSLATQAYLGRRKDMFRDELLIALKLVQSGTIRMDVMIVVLVSFRAAADPIKDGAFG
jgi:membrane-bound lytic murein transglycosylase B